MMDKINLLLKSLSMGISWLKMLFTEGLYFALNYIDQRSTTSVALSILVYAIAVIGYAKLLQSRYNKLIDTPEPVSLKSQLKLEFHFSVLFPLLGPFYVAIRLFNKVKNKVWALIKREKKTEDKKENPPDIGVLTASLGPSFMISGFLTSALIVLALLLDRLLAADERLQC